MYKPSPDYLETPADRKHRATGERTRYFSFELEAEGDRDTAEQVSGENWLYCKDDGSIGNGYEVVTHPFTWNWMKTNEHLKIRSLLATLRSAGMKSYKTSSCGIHIHVSKNTVSSYQIYKLWRFFSENQNFILSISQRRLSALRQWASLTGESANQSQYDIIKKAKDKYNPFRYEAINLQNSKSIEFRIFKGTLHGNSFMKNLEFVHAALVFTENTSHRQLDRPRFVAFVDGERKTYPNLFNFIHKQGRNQ